MKYTTITMKFVVIVILLLIGIQMFCCYSPMDYKCYFDNDDNNEDYYYYNNTVQTTTTTIRTSIIDMPFEELVKEIKSRINEPKEILCPKYKERIVKHCLKEYEKHTDYDLENMENFLYYEETIINICNAFNRIYMECLLTFLNEICQPKDFLSLHEENKAIQTMCRSFHYQLVLNDQKETD
ncbi:hypothetical protein DERP_006620 [Dermatophagoides pteronyssinus]|uniref:Uncharacterized protein n=1 Tax=Dermatophagoides pteronyssinus TaxID=6956 RepID=A0ABQ8IQQ0_DERPT|nr:hypothetical protein DERP_006620 [Dermatophagoides pteronyssinus]